MASAACELSLPRQLLFALPQLSQALVMAMMVQWLTYFYVPPEGGSRTPLVAAALFAILMLGGRIVDAVADPMVGHWSDRLRSSMGRRRPFMLWGTPILMASFVALFFPPAATPGVVNGVWLCFWLILFWLAFTAVVAPYSALLPEIARSSPARVRLSTIMGLFMLAGMILSAVMIGPWQSKYPDGALVLGMRIPSGIQMGALVTALTLALFFVPVAAIRESPPGPQKNIPAGLLGAIASAFANPAFRTFVVIAALLQMALTMIIASFPYLCTMILERAEGESGWVAPGQGEAWAGYLIATATAGSICAIGPMTWMQRRWGKKRTMMVGGYALSGLSVGLSAVPSMKEPALGMLIFCGLLGFPAACALILVNPMYADVVDYDEKHTGLRREGLYNGAMAVVNKTALGIASAIVVVLVGFEAGTERPIGLLLLGPLAGLAILCGTILFRRYPITE